MALANLHICTGSTVPSLRHTVISTKIKCAGPFDLFTQTGHALDIKR